MPMPIGNFISDKVYRGRLRSQHENHDSSCVTFIDVSQGMEEKQGTSWKVQIFCVILLTLLIWKIRIFGKLGQSLT